jgi:hypothetical protein
LEFSNFQGKIYIAIISNGNMRSMRRERRKTAQRKQAILDIILEKQPIKTMDLFRETCNKLGRDDHLSQSTFFHYLNELEEAGIIEKTALGWRVNRRGLLHLQRVNYLNNLLGGQRLIYSELADVFCAFEDQWLEAGLSQISSDIAEEVICQFFIQATFSFLRTRLELDEELKPDLFRFFESFVRSVGQVVWVGYCASAEDVGARNLWELVDKVMKNEVLLERLSTFMYYGLRKTFAGDAEALAFIKALWRVGFFGKLIISLVIQDVERVKKIYSNIDEFPQEDELEKISAILRQYLEWLRGLEATIVIPISAKFLTSIPGRIALNEFEAWLRALKEGRLDHRSWIFTRGKQLLEKLITQLKRLEAQELKAAPLEFLGRAHPELYEVLIERVDPQENWVLEDLFECHPRGRDIAFYQELLGEIERRSDANLELCRKT